MVNLFIVSCHRFPISVMLVADSMKMGEVKQPFSPKCKSGEFHDNSMLFDSFQRM